MAMRSMRSRQTGRTTRDRLPQTVDELRREILAEREDVRLALERSRMKRSIAMTLVGLRKRVGLTQSELAAKVGWDKGYVSRLEGASGGLPDLETIRSYAAACQTSVRLEFGSGAGAEFQPLETVKIVEDDQEIGATITQATYKSGA
jgi:transcriptional regulator with XRE-family HTH domain